MVRRLEKLAEASKNLFSKAAIGTTISLAAFTFSPDRAESQTSKVCYDDPSYKLTVRNDGSFYKFTMNVHGQLESFWAQDDIVSASGDCYHINQGRAVRTSHRGETALATPSFVRSRRSNNARNHRNTRGRSDLGEALETANDVANIAGGVAAIVDLFSGNNNSGNNSENNSPNQERNYHPNPNRAEDSPYVDNPSESQDKKDNSSESPYENESANVRNAQGERHESPYVSDNESSSGNSLYDMEDKKEGSNGNPDESLYKMNGDKSKNRVSDVSPGLMMGDKDLKKFGEAPLSGELYSAKQNVSDMRGEGNPIENWYRTNLRRANEYFGCRDPGRKESSFFCADQDYECEGCDMSVIEGRRDFSKIVTYKLIPK